VSRKIFFVLIGLGLGLIMGFGLAARMTSPSGSTIPRDVVASGGGRSVTTTNYVLQGTIGQPATAISVATNGTILVGGFQASTPRPSTRARNWQLY